MSVPNFLSNEDKKLVCFWLALVTDPSVTRPRSLTCPASSSGSKSDRLKELTQQDTESSTAQDDFVRTKAYLKSLKPVGVSSEVLFLPVIAMQKFCQEPDSKTTDKVLEKLEEKLKEKDEEIVKKDLYLNGLAKEVLKLGNEIEKWKDEVMEAQDEVDEANNKIAEMQSDERIMNFFRNGCLLGWTLGLSAMNEEVKKLRDEISLGLRARDEEVKKLRDEIEILNVRNSSPQENQSNEDSKEQNTTSTEEDESEAVAKKKLKTEQSPTK